MKEWIDWIVGLLNMLIGYLKRLLALLEQIEQMEAGCINLDHRTERECLIFSIEAYGVTVDDSNLYLSNNDRLRQLLNALETTGQQIQECMKNCDGSNEMTSIAAFNTVFDVPITVGTNSLLRNQAQLRAMRENGSESNKPCDNEDEGEILGFIIELPQGTQDTPALYGCRKLGQQGVGEGTPTPTPVPTPTPNPNAKCGPGESVVPLADDTFEALIRHELGHAFLNMLKDTQEYENIIAEYLTLTGSDWNTDTQSYQARNLPRVPLSIYFPNATRDDGPSPCEDFADTFSVMGRFTNEDIREGAGFRGNKEHKIAIEDSSRVGFFNDNFCCWLAAILEKPCLCPQ